MAEKALELDAEKVMVVDRWQGGQGKIEFFKIGQGGLESIPPLIYVSNVKFRRDFGEKISKRKMESAIIAVSSKKNLEIQKIEDALSSFFSVPVLSINEAVDDDDYDVAMQILPVSSNRIAITFRLIPGLVEVGPRIGISRLVWKLTK
jgi:rRNA maturation protein Rpf1